MNRIKILITQLFNRKELFQYLVLIISGLSLFGWISGNSFITSFSLKYIPIAPSTVIVFIALSFLFLIKIPFNRSTSINSITTALIILVAFYCGLILLDFIFNFTWDLENIFISTHKSLGNVPIGRMSPITSLLFILICLGISGINNLKNNILKYIGGSLSLLVAIISSILLLGYLYKAPLLYGGQIIPVSLSSASCFLLFSCTLLRFYEPEFWTFNIISYDKTTLQLLKSFLPVVVFIIVLQGFLITHFPIVDNNPTLSSGLILIIVFALTIGIVTRISTSIGTQLHRTEQALRESEEKSRSIMENSADAIFITDLQGKYVYTNIAVSNMLGYSKEEMLAKTIKDLAPESRIDEYIGMFRKVMTEGKVYAEIQLLKKDGNFITTDVNAVLLPDSLVYGSCRDITKRRIEEDLLKKERTKYQELADSISDVFIAMDKDLKYTYWNKGSERLTGISAENAIGKSLMDLFPDSEALQNIKDMYLQVIESKTPKHFIEQYPGGDDHIIHEISAYPSADGVSIFVKDISERIRAEIALKESERKLFFLNADKDRFISILGHDLKSPFNNLLGLSEVLKEDIHKLNLSEIEEIAVDINKSARNTYKLLDELLMWARAQQGQIPFKPQQFRVSDIYMNIYELLNPIAIIKDIKIDYSSIDHLTIFADIDMLKTILRNLITNAIKFSEKNGTIKINAEENSENITISVADNGIGIKAEDITKLFDISQVFTTKGTAKESGTGLGLLLCKEFVDKHGGNIWVKSEYGKGSTFYFTIPKRSELSN